MHNYVVAADIGNTNTHIGLLNCTNRTILSLDIFPSEAIDERLVESLAVLSGSMRESEPVPVAICSVIASIEKRFSAAIAEAVKGPIAWLRHDSRLPFRLDYDKPERFGADRLANLMYAHAVLPGESSIIIDAGTAITIDYLKKGSEFAGGVILPGPGTQIKSLHENTDQLPSLEAVVTDLEFPGLSTASCMLGGVRFGIAGALSHLVAKYRRHFNEESIVLATGGSWKYLQDAVDFEFRYIPELTLVGCALYYESLKAG